MCRSESCTQPLCPATANVLPADMPSQQLIRPMKPKLPRKLANSARINLNRYWHALEDLMPVSRKVFDESDCNAINENLDNERRLAAMQLSETQRSESQGPSSSLEVKLSPMLELSLSNLSHQGKNPSGVSSLPKISFDNSSVLQSSEPSFLKIVPSDTSNTRVTVGPSLQGFADALSGDENTPPNSTFYVNAQR